MHFAREPNRAKVGRLFELYYDAGSEKMPRIDLPVTTLPSGEEYLRLPTDGGVVLSTLLALHLMAYAAGMLVRYHPGYWAMLTGKTKGGRDRARYVRRRLGRRGALSRPDPGGHRGLGRWRSKAIATPTIIVRPDLPQKT